MILVFDSKSISPSYIADKIRSFYESEYGVRDIGTTGAILDDIINLFNGNMKGFHRCDTGYHDLVHTLQVIPPFIEIITGWNKSGQLPKISKRYAEAGMIAVILHDTGYIKKEGDTDGTGAKYTFEHIKRSMDFASYYLPQKGIDQHLIAQIKNIICCTGVSINLDEIHFHSEEEKLMGYALGTADLLGQMSADDYVEKLPILYDEFKESYLFIGTETLAKNGVNIFKNAEELMTSTRSFYENFVMNRFHMMGSIYNYVTFNYNDMKNPYIEAIEKNIKKIEDIMSKTAKNILSETTLNR